jgi:hypothetical protein
MIVGGEDFDDTFGDMPDSRWDGMDFIDQYGEQLLLLIILLCALALVYWAVKRSGRTFGRKSLKSRHKESAEAIYYSVKWHLDRALKASGAVVLERGREVAEVLNARLGLVIDISAKTQKLYDDIKEAGNSQKKPAGGPPKVKVAKATRDQYFDVRDALEELNEFWSAKDEKGRPKVLAMIEAAQHELATGPKVQIKAPDLLFGLAQNPKVGKPATAKPAGPVNAAPAGAVPQATAKPIVIETVPPPEPPPPAAPSPARKKGKALPAHKRNMLA